MNKVKFLEACSFYKNYLEGFYLKSPGLEFRNYAEQYRTIMDDCFSWADFWKLNLEKTGQFEAEIFIINAEQLQKQWARENHIKFSGDNWMLEILEAQMAAFKPTVFFAHDFRSITPDFREKIKNKLPSIKLTIAWDGIAENNPKTFAGCDLILSCLDFVADFYKQAGFKSYLFPLCFEKSILEKIKFNRPLYDVSFSGSISLKHHQRRLEILAELSRKTKIDIWALGIGNGNLLARPQIKRLLNLQFKQYLDIRQIAQKNHGAAFGLEMYQILADSKIAFNNHIDVAKNTAGNMRLFEATGVGACLLTDYKDNLKNHFEPEVEVVTYKSTGECLDKIKYLLNHESERTKIAAAGQKRTLENYTYEKRLRQFADYLLNLI